MRWASRARHLSKFSGCNNAVCQIEAQAPRCLSFIDAANRLCRRNQRDGRVLHPYSPYPAVLVRLFYIPPGNCREPGPRPVHRSKPRPRLQRFSPVFSAPSALSIFIGTVVIQFLFQPFDTREQFLGSNYVFGIDDGPGFHGFVFPYSSKDKDGVERFFDHLMIQARMGK